MSLTRRTGNSLWRMFSRCMGVHSYNTRDRRGAWKARSGCFKCWILRTVQKLFWDADHTQPEALVIGTAADLTPHAAWGYVGRLLRDSYLEEDISAVPKALKKRF